MTIDFSESRVLGIYGKKDMEKQTCLESFLRIYLKRNHLRGLYFLMTEESSLKNSIIDVNHLVWTV